MKRRRLLATSLTAGIAGCLVNEGGQSTPGDTTSSPNRIESGPTATPIEDDPPTYQPSESRSKDLEGSPFVRARIATMPEPVPFRPWIELRQQPAPGTAGKLEVGMTNRTNRTFAIYGSTPNPFSGWRSEAGIRISDSPVEIEDGCPRGREISRGAKAHDQVEPRQSTSKTYPIFVVHDKEICFPPGEHQFDGYRQVFDSRQDDDPSFAFKWWFTLITE